AGSNLTICIGDIVQLDAGVDSAIYFWTPAQSLDKNTIQRPMASPTQTTTYTVAVTKCMTTSTDQVTIFINTLDKPTIRLDGSKIVSTPGKSYQWYRDGVLVRGANGKTFKPDAAGNYKVKIKNQKGCLVESSSLFFLPSGRNDKVCDGIRVICTPNPSPGVVYVILSKLPTKPVAVTVVDRYGQRLYTTTISNHSNMLNLSKLAKGHYSVEVIINNEKIAVPIILH
ncbi:MAG: T9SS type A sorting domain-containing protein, partial [Chitinophagaceae bacterium]|nr:T9SS type A sorting domain-containing protein [Chitinophagaceae bacterium]